MSVILKIEKLSKRFGGVIAINEFSAEIKERSIHGLIGPNGAGKTTVFNLITGYIKPDTGKVEYNGQDITALPPEKVSRLGITRTFQNLRLFKNLSVEDNVRMGCHKLVKYNLVDSILLTRKYRSCERELDDRVEALLDLLGLSEFRKTRVSELPYGTQRKVEIARALAAEPKVLLLDEPSAGMNTSEKKELIETIRYIHKKFDLTLVVIEHSMEVIGDLCDYIQVLDHGRVIAEGTFSEVRNDPAVISAFIGGDEDVET